LVRRYGKAQPVVIEELLSGPTPYRKLQALYPYFVRQQTDASCSVPQRPGHPDVTAAVG